MSKDFGYYEIERDFNEDHFFTRIEVYKTKVPGAIAEMAMQMACRWGLVAATPDGEDSAGRQKLKKQLPADLAKEACDTAAALWAQFEERGWIVDLPAPRKIARKKQENA
jgi:hypothetical protein